MMGDLLSVELELLLDPVELLCLDPFQVVELLFLCPYHQVVHLDLYLVLLLEDLLCQRRSRRCLLCLSKTLQYKAP